MVVLRLILAVPMQTSILLTCQDRSLLVYVVLETTTYLKLTVIYGYIFFFTYTV